MNNDSSTRAVGFVFLFLAGALAASGIRVGYIETPPAYAARNLEPIIIVTATPSLPTVLPVEPTVAPLAVMAAPEPTPAPVVEVRYVEVYVVEPMQAPVSPVPLEAYYNTVAVPEGGMQVSIAPVGEKPIVSSIHVTGIDHPRPERFTGQPVGPERQSREAPEAATP
jgi:hypothetical protein